MGSLIKMGEWVFFFPFFQMPSLYNGFEIFMGFDFKLAALWLLVANLRDSWDSTCPKMDLSYLFLIIAYKCLLWF